VQRERHGVIDMRSSERTSFGRVRVQHRDSVRCRSTRAMLRGLAPSFTVSQT
jgi:hypothetical protein